METDAGERINHRTALHISTVYACLRILSESVASLPVKLLNVTPRGRVQELEDPLAYLLGVSPNTEMTAFSFYEAVTFSLMLTGNGYAQIERDANGSPVGLWPLNPRLTRPVRMPSGDLAYETQDGESGQNKRIISSKDTIHVLLTSHDGIVGMSPIEQAARSLGIAAASAKFASRFYTNSAMPKVVLSSDQKLKPEDVVKIRQDWEARHAGSNQHRVSVLASGLEAKALTITPNECQFIETRIHERSEICSIFRVPSYMIGSEAKIANSNLEQMNLSFIIDTLRPILTRIEAELVRKLIPGRPGVAPTQAIQFDLSERQRGDTAAQVSLIAAGRQWGLLTINDGRQILGLPALEGEDVDTLMVPENMQSSKKLLKDTAPDPPYPPEQVVPNE